jgi:hypothetical protein
MMMAFWIIDALKAKKKYIYIKRVLEQMAFCSFIGIEATSKKGQYISVNLLKATVLQKKKKKL